MTILILGGTGEASELITQLATYPQIKTTLSLAGATRNPKLPKTHYRIGGFGGVSGLIEYIKEHNITALICATHPFAAKMPFHALEAAQIANIPLLYILRPQWQPQAGDRWIEVESHEQAIEHLNSHSDLINRHHPAPLPEGEGTSRVFLTVGRLDLDRYKVAPQHFYLIRTIDEVEEKNLPNAGYITARPPFNVDDEYKLMQHHNIEYLITKNSGGEATQAKLIAARQLNIPVILIKRPIRPDWQHVENVGEAVEWVTLDPVSSTG